MNTDLERELRDAARSFDHIAASADAWQQNQRRLAASRSRRGARLLAAVAAVVAVLLVGGLLAVATGGRDDGAPASGGGDDPFATQYLLGPPVEVERLEVDGAPTVHEAVLSDMTGKGPSLCDRLVAGSSASGGCTRRDPNADDPAVAFDWLTGSEGGDLRGVLAGVDGRVSFVDIWMSNGDRVAGRLKSGGWEDTRLLGLTVPTDGPVPQRLVALGRDGNVLQAVDLPARFGDHWLPTRRSCQGDEQGQWPVPGSGGPEDVAIAFGTTDALVTGSAGVTPVCLRRLSSTPIAGLTTFGAHVVAVLAPETELARVQVGTRTVAELKPFAARNAPWRVVVVRDLSANDLSRAELVAYDLHGVELDREFLHQPASP